MTPHDAAPLRALGLMSGTSMDGVDLALVETDGAERLSTGPTLFVPFAPDLRSLVRAALPVARTLADRAARPPALAAAEAALTEAYAAAIATFLSQTRTDPSAIDVIGLHGQTVFHAPERGLTVQLGDGAALADRSGRPVAFDFRAADVAAGGEGAPLVPVYHRALAAGAALPRPLLVANFGGVANVTFIGGEGSLVACDTGPASALLDDLVEARTGAPYDAGGAIAARGRADPAALARLMDHPFFALPPPKSLDRDAFDATPVAALALEDAAATLVAFTAAAFAAVLPHLPDRPVAIVASGGGARNATMMAAVAAATGIPVTPADDLGWSADFVEAQAFAYLAVRHLRGLPLTFPGTTGVPAPTPGGVLARPGSGVGATRLAS